MKSIFALRLVIAFSAGAMLMQQVMLTRLFSAMVYYHFAFAAVSFTMFGLTYGAVRVFVRHRHDSSSALLEKLPRWLGLYSTFSALAVGCLLLSSFKLGDGIDALLLLLGATMALFITAFVWGGAIIAVLLTRFSAHAASLYAADLAGAAIGCWLTVLLLDTLGLINSLLTVAVIPAAAAWFLSKHLAGAKDWRIFTVAAPLLLIAGISLQLFAPNQMMLHTIKRGYDDFVRYEAWNSYSRVTVDGSLPGVPDDVTLSPRASTYTPDIRYAWLRIDSDAATLLTSFEGDFSRLDFMRQDITTAPYELRTPERVGVIGVGGGRDIIIALLHGAKQVTGIEVNRAILNVLTNVYADFAGRIHEDERVRLVNDEARGHIARLKEPLDLIQISLVDTWAAVASGAFALTENGLYTLDGWQVFWQALSADGMMSFTRWYDEEKHVGELYRMLAMAHALLKNNGMEDPRQHIVVATYPKHQLATLVISKSPISLTEATRFRERMEAKELLVPILPGTPLPNRDFEQLITEGTLNDALLDISPPTDDKPFFFNMLNPNSLFGFPEGQSRNANLMAIRILFLMLGAFTLIGATLIFEPLKFGRKLFTRYDVVAPFCFFASIGFGFMLIEIPLIQRLSLYLGRPVLALIVVLFGLLLATGAGSAISARLKISGRVLIGTIPLVLLAVIAALNPLVFATYTLGEPLRIALALLTVAIPGFWMGMAFPLGLGACSRKGYEELLPWFWAINGAASIIGSVLALIIAIFYGISTALFVGVAFYVAAWLAYSHIIKQP